MTCMNTRSDMLCPLQFLSKIKSKQSHVLNLFRNTLTLSSASPASVTMLVSCYVLTDTMQVQEMSSPVLPKSRLFFMRVIVFFIVASVLVVIIVMEKTKSTPTSLASYKIPSKFIYLTFQFTSLVRSTVGSHTTHLDNFVTVFAPSNDAMEEFNGVKDVNLILNHMGKSLIVYI